MTLTDLISALRDCDKGINLRTDLVLVRPPPTYGRLPTDADYLYVERVERDEDGVYLILSEDEQ